MGEGHRGHAPAEKKNKIKLNIKNKKIRNELALHTKIVGHIPKFLFLFLVGVSWATDGSTGRLLTRRNPGGVPRAK